MPDAEFMEYFFNGAPPQTPESTPPLTPRSQTDIRNNVLRRVRMNILPGESMSPADSPFAHINQGTAGKIFDDNDFFTINCLKRRRSQFRDSVNDLIELEEQEKAIVPNLHDVVDVPPLLKKICTVPRSKSKRFHADSAWRAPLIY